MTGIDDLKINSRCYQIFEKTKALELKNEEHWKKFFISRLVIFALI